MTLALTGCESAFQPPTRIGVTTLDLSPVPPFLMKRILLQQELEALLEKPVVFDLMTPRQIGVHLGTGRMQFAMLSPADYAEVAEKRNSEILAVPTNSRGQTYRRGLIVVAPKSPYKQLADLKQVRFHFLAKGDLLNEAAMGALLEAGVDLKKLDKGFLGLELDTSHVSSLEVAKSVAIEEAVAAGVIDEADYDAWPDRGGSLLLFTPSKEQLRVIGRTVRVPEGPFVASLATPKEDRDAVREYLLETINDKQFVLASLGITGFAEPIDAVEYQPYIDLHEKLTAMNALTTQPE